MDFFIFTSFSSSFTPPTFGCKDDIYVVLLGTKNFVGVQVGPLLSMRSCFCSSSQSVVLSLSSPLPVVLYSVYCTQCTVLAVLYSKYCTQCTVQCVLYSVYCTRCTVLTVLYSVYCTMCTLFSFRCLEGLLPIIFI